MSKRLFILALMLMLSQFIPSTYAQTIKVNDQLRQLAFSRKPIQTKTLFIIGTITAVNDTDVELYKGLVKIDAKNSLIRSNLKQNLPISVLKVGQEISVEATVQRDGNSVRLVANSILFSLDDEIIFDAKIQSINPAARTVNLLNRQFQLDADTQITNNEGKTLDFSRIKPNNILRILAQKVDQTLQAKNIVVFEDNGIPGASIEGVITKIDGMQLNVLDNLNFDRSNLRIFGTDQGCPTEQFDVLKVGHRGQFFFVSETSEPFKLDSLYTNSDLEGNLFGKLEKVDRRNRVITLANQMIQITDESLLIKPNSEPIPADLKMIRAGKLYSINVKSVDGKLVVTRMRLIPEDRPILSFSFPPVCQF